jgi:hypothetical protein
MISRIWHGWTTAQNADAYEKLLRHEIIEGFIDLEIEGFRKMHILRRILGDEKCTSFAGFLGTKWSSLQLCGLTPLIPSESLLEMTTKLL